MNKYSKITLHQMWSRHSSDSRYRYISQLWFWIPNRTRYNTILYDNVDRYRTIYNHSKSALYDFSGRIHLVYGSRAREVDLLELLTLR
jgi:hypothetical protein